MKISSLVTFCCALLLISCRKENSEKIDQKDIYTSYQVIYDADQNRTYSRAWFRVNNSGGEFLKLSDKSELTVNGGSFDYIGNYSWYEKKQSGKLATHNFSYKDLDGNLYTNNLVLADSISFPLSIDTIYQDSTTFIQWLGEPLAADEKVRLTVFDSTTLATNIPVLTIDSVGKNGVYIESNNFEYPNLLNPSTSNFFNRLNTGHVIVFFEREKKFSTNAPAAGGQAVSVYSSARKVIWLAKKD